MPLEMSTLEPGVACLVERAIKADHRAMALFFNLARSVDPAPEGRRTWDKVLPLLTEEELEFLEPIVLRYDLSLKGNEE